MFFKVFLELVNRILNIRILSLDLVKLTIDSGQVRLSIRHAINDNQLTSLIGRNLLDDLVLSPTYLTTR